MKDLTVHLKESVLDTTAEEFNLDFYDIFSDSQISQDQAEVARDFNHIIIPEHVEYIDQYAFADMPNIRSVEIRSKNLVISNGAFRGCHNLEEVAFAVRGIKYIRLRAETFEDCLRLKTITLPRNCDVEDSDSVFRGCTSLEEIVLQTYIETLPSQFLSGCTSLKKLVLPRVCTKIGTRALAGCTSLTDLRAPNVNVLGTEALIGCTGLTSLSLDLRSSGNLYSDCFNACTGLKRIDLIVDKHTMISTNVFLGLYVPVLSIRYSGNTEPDCVRTIRRDHEEGRLAIGQLRINDKINS